MPLIATVTAYPNNEVRSRLSPPSARRVTSASDSSVADRVQTEVGMSPACPGEHKYLPDAKALTQYACAPLDISSDFATASPKAPKPGYGTPPKPTRFGLFAKRKLQRIGGVIDTIVPHPTDGLFLTGTLPGGTKHAMDAIANYSAYIVHCLKSWVAKRCRSQMDFYVWEHQKRGALHLHYYVYVPSHSERYYIYREFKSEWIRILDSVCTKSGVDLYARRLGGTHASDKSVVQAVAQFVEKSVAAYLSKYCSKQSSNHSPEYSRLRCPSRWWGCSRELSRKLDEMTTRHTIEFSSHSKARAVYEELTATLSRWSIKGYRYGDKVGYGLNHVFYYSPGEQESVMSEISRTFVPFSATNFTWQSRALAELSRCLEAIKNDKKLGVYVTANLSEVCTKVWGDIELRSECTCGEAYAIASEIYMLATCYINSRGFATNFDARVRNRLNTLSKAFESPYMVRDVVRAAHSQ